MSKERANVWVVIHCEYMQRGAKAEDGAFVDEMVFHVAGSLRAAAKYVRVVKGMPFSWWKIQRRVIDETDFDADDRPETRIYSHNGKLLKSEPHATAMRAFKKELKNRDL